MKKMITAKYVSIRQFANEISIPYTTLQSIFKRGLKAGIQNIIKICQALNIDINALANGKIEEPKTNDTTATASKKELLKNYRRLDKYGKTTVKSIINCEYKRVQEQSSQIQEKKHLSSHKNRILHNLYLNIALFVFITAF